MPFSFLNPWLWFGALAIGAPLWLHLRRKQQTNLLRFSTIRFLQDQPEAQRSPRQMRNFLLFALRMTAMLLLVSAFAWPYVKSLNTVPVQESRVYILDNTLSHQSGDGFARDRNKIAEDLAQLGSDTQAAVVELTALPRVVVAFGDTRQAAAQTVKDLHPSFQRGSYLAAFRQAASLLDNSFGQNKRIIFLGDNQRNQWSENVNTPPFLRNVQVSVPQAPVASSPNLSLSDPRAQRIFLGDKTLVNFTIRLTHTGSAGSAKVRVNCNEQTIFERAVNLENQPETILLTAQWEAETKDWLRGEATVEGSPDSLSADNRVFFSLAPVVEGKVALLAQSPYLRLALSPEIMKGEWAARILDPGRLRAEAAADLDAEVLCMESGYLQSAEARKLLSRYLSNGRGVLLLVNRTTPAIDGFLRELGFESEGAVHPGADHPEKFQFVLSNHPIFHPFLSPDYGNLMEIKVSDYVRLKASQAMPLVFGEKGEGLFFQASKLKGKLFVCAFGLDREHTSWPIHQSFIPFLDLALQTARAEDSAPTAFEPGDLASFAFSPNREPREAVLRNGDQEMARYALDAGRVRIRVPDIPGLYSLSLDESSQVQKMFTVNPSPKESELSYLDSPETLQTWQLNKPSEPSPAAANPAPARLRLAGVLQQRFWWWMVMGGVLLLLVETAWAGAKREPA